jgi:hypothetical protein
MFDRVYDAEDQEWQTKAFKRHLMVYRIGDEAPHERHATFQIQIFGRAEGAEKDVYSFATVRDGRLASVNEPRDELLPLVDYYGFLSTDGEHHLPENQEATKRHNEQA